MWNGSNQRIKALMSARERERTRLTRPIRVERADIKLNYKHADGSAMDIPARALLNEFTTDGICLFTTTPLVPNLEISVAISHPKEFTIQAKVIWCQYQPSSSHVLTSQPFAYRVGLAFQFTDAAQVEVFQKFCAEMREKYAITRDKIATVTPIHGDANKAAPSAEATGAPEATATNSNPAEDKKAA
jgi:hypothetical protein